MNNYQNLITIEPGKRGGKPCVRSMRITVGDVLGWLASGMTHDEIFEEELELDGRIYLNCADLKRGYLEHFSQASRCKMVPASVEDAV